MSDRRDKHLISGFQALLANVHGKAIHGRRVRQLAKHLGEMLPAPCQSLLDVGCGDGRIDTLVRAARPNLRVQGLDVLVRPDAQIPVAAFDGKRLPYADRDVDVVMFVDVLHHTADPGFLLAEARRVARHGVLIKDHYCENWLDERMLAAMDWVGNFGHGVALPYNYWSRAQWSAAWLTLGLKAVETRTALGLYPPVARAAFERHLHFVTFLSPT
jgi:SAM-dependent methyltransferase